MNHLSGLPYRRLRVLLAPMALAAFAFIVVACEAEPTPTPTPTSTPTPTATPQIGPSELLSQVPEGYDRVEGLDVEDLLRGEGLNATQDDFMEEWMWTEEYGIVLDDVTGIVAGSNSVTLVLFSGLFDWEDIRSKLEDARFQDSTYRGVEMWEDRDEYLVAVLLEERDEIAISFPGDVGVRELVRALETESGFFLGDEDSEVRRALDRVPGGFQVEVEDGCSNLVGVPGCRVLAYSARRGEERSTIALEWAFLFRSDTSARLGLLGIEDFFGEEMPLRLNVNEVVQEGEFVIVRAVLDEDDFSFSVSPTHAVVLVEPVHSPELDRARIAEFQNISTAVSALMVDNNFSQIPNPVTGNTSPCAVGTQDMTAFPDPTSDRANDGKVRDPSGRAYALPGDKPGYLVFGHDITADGSQAGLLNYLRGTASIYCDTVDRSGTVRQYDEEGSELPLQRRTTGRFTDEDEPTPTTVPTVRPAPTPTPTFPPARPAPTATPAVAPGAVGTGATRYIAGVGVPQAVMRTAFHRDGAVVAYHTVPATSGDHWSTPTRCGFYGEEIPDEILVHNMEHGNVIMSHNLTNTAELARLKDIHNNLRGSGDWLVTRPDFRLPEGAIVMTAWGVLDRFIGIDQERIRRFFDAYKGNRFSQETRSIGRGISCASAPQIARPAPTATQAVVEQARPAPTPTPTPTASARLAPPPMIIDTSKQYIAILITEKGHIVIALNAQKAPVTVNNFVYLARRGFYDNTTFHRVIPGFMAQGGDPTGTGSGGPGYNIPDEFTDLKHGRGVISMANTGQPNSGGSQFFITYAPQPHLDGRHTVFGEVLQGMDVLESLTPRDPVQSPSVTGDRLLEVIIEEVG